MSPPLGAAPDCQPGARVHLAGPRVAPHLPRTRGEHQQDHLLLVRRAGGWRRRRRPTRSHCPHQDLHGHCDARGHSDQRVAAGHAH